MKQDKTMRSAVSTVAAPYCASGDDVVTKEENTEVSIDRQGEGGEFNITDWD